MIGKHKKYKRGKGRKISYIKKKIRGDTKKKKH